MAKQLVAQINLIGVFCHLNSFLGQSLVKLEQRSRIRKRPKLLALGVSSSKLVTTNRALKCHMQNWKRFSHIIK